MEEEEKPKAVHRDDNHDKVTLTMIPRNTSLLTGDDRIHEVIQELSGLNDKHKDFATINETWRTQEEELWRTKEGRTWTSTGNSKALHGTAARIHKRWSKHIKVVQHSLPTFTGETVEKNKFGLQSTSVNFSHTDMETNTCNKYTPSSKHTPSDAGRHIHTLVGRDFNAQVGANNEHDGMNEDREHALDSKHVGGHALGTQNRRRQWLKHWAVQHWLVLANTLFEKQECCTTTNNKTKQATRRCAQSDQTTQRRRNNGAGRLGNRPQDSTDTTDRDTEAEKAKKTWRQQEQVVLTQNTLPTRPNPTRRPTQQHLADSAASSKRP